MAKNYDKYMRQCRANATLSDEQVRAIRRADAEGTHSRRDLGKIYRVGTETIARICRGDTYQWVDLGVEEYEAKVERGDFAHVKFDSREMQEGAEQLFALQQKLNRGRGEGKKEIPDEVQKKADYFLGKAAAPSDNPAPQEDDLEMENAFEIARRLKGAGK